MAASWERKRTATNLSIQHKFYKGLEGPEPLVERNFKRALEMASRSSLPSLLLALASILKKSSNQLKNFLKPNALILYYKEDKGTSISTLCSKIFL